jgi:hypothetical protein
MRAMHAVIQAEGLDARIPEHLSLAFLKVRPAPGPQPVPVAEPADVLTLAARQLISSCGGEHATRKIIADMSATEYQRRSSDPVFVRADELVNPRAAQPLLTRGDHVVAQDKREREHTAQLTRETVEAVERSRREFSSGFANHREPEPSQHFSNPLASPWQREGIGGTARPRRKMLSKEELECNERENAARNRQPENPRADAIREEQLRQGRARQERLSR